MIGERLSDDQIAERVGDFFAAAVQQRMRHRHLRAEDLGETARRLELKDRKTIPAELRQALLAEPCAYCGGPADEVDHVHPVSQNGSNSPANLAPACRFCNREKANWDVAGWRGRRLAAGLTWPPSAEPVDRIQELLGT